VDNLRIVIAGPGSGKTHNLKEEVLRNLPDLDDHKYCAVITYTNAATEELRNRLSEEIKIKYNIFISTIHSFLIRFVIEPYGHLIPTLSIPLEKRYIDNVIIDDSRYRNMLQKKLADKGFITYEKALQLSKEILSNNLILNLFVNRFQNIFIDEYQDAHKNTHKSVEEIINKKLDIYVIGDPLQYIYNFSNKIKKDFNKTPLKQLQNKYSQQVIGSKINYRSSKAIVSLINMYISDIEFKQQSISGENNIPLCFIKSSTARILNEYSNLKEDYKIIELSRKTCDTLNKVVPMELILTSNWIDNESSKYPKLFSLNTLVKESSVTKLPTGNYKNTSQLQEISRCVLGIINKKKNEFINDIYDEIEFRKFCHELIELFQKKQFKDYQHQVNTIKSEFSAKFNFDTSTQNEIDVEKSLLDFTLKPKTSSVNPANSFFSTIHSSKGLEATSVLVIAYSQNELIKWLDFEKANTELDDDYRLGYVAYSRARDLLCIACLEDIDNETENKLIDLGFKLFGEKDSKINTNQQLEIDFND